MRADQSGKHHRTRRSLRRTLMRSTTQVEMTVTLLDQPIRADYANDLGFLISAFVVFIRWIEAIG